MMIVDCFSSLVDQMASAGRNCWLWISCILPHVERASLGLLEIRLKSIYRQDLSFKSAFFSFVIYIAMNAGCPIISPIINRRCGHFHCRKKMRPYAVRHRNPSLAASESAARCPCRPPSAAFLTNAFYWDTCTHQSEQQQHQSEQQQLQSDLVQTIKWCQFTKKNNSICFNSSLQYTFGWFEELIGLDDFMIRLLLLKRLCNGRDPPRECVSSPRKGPQTGFIIIISCC